jgi:hypothetical protein
MDYLSTALPTVTADMAASNVDETVKFKYQEFGCRAVRNNYN